MEPLYLVRGEVAGVGSRHQQEEAESKLPLLLLLSPQSTRCLKGLVPDPGLVRALETPGVTLEGQGAAVLARVGAVTLDAPATQPQLAPS